MDIWTWLPTRPTPRPRDGKIIRCSNQLWKLSVTGGAWKGWREVVETPVCGPCGDFKVTRVGIIVPVLGTGRQWLESGQCQSELWIRSMELVPDWPDNYWITTWREDNATEAQHTSRALERNKSVGLDRNDSQWEELAVFTVRVLTATSLISRLDQSSYSCWSLLVEFL